MSLPNQNMDFTAFDVLTADQLDDLVENIESLEDGSGIAADAIQDSKLMYGKIRSRQGGDANNFHIYGANTYDLSATNTYIQFGYSQGAAGADSTVTFPNAFAQKPAVFLQIAGGNASSGDSTITENSFALITSAISTTGFTWRGINTAGTQTNQSIYWLAMGL